MVVSDIAIFVAAMVTNSQYVAFIVHPHGFLQEVASAFV